MQSVAQLMDHVSERLVGLKAARWVPVLHCWLSQYRGLYDVISGDSESPESQIATLLEQRVDPIDDAELAARLARLDFLTWRARNGNKPWHPLEMPFQQFWEEEVTVWQSDREYPEPTETERWLLACLRDISPCPIP